MLNIDKLISVCIVVLLVGLAGLVSIGVSNPSWSPFVEGPENINNVSVENAILGLMNDVGSLSVKGAVSVLAGTPSDTLWGESEQAAFSLDFDGEISSPNESENVNASFNIDGKFIIDEEQLDAVIKVMFIDDDVYIKENASEDFLLDDFKEIVGDEWLKIERESFEAQRNIMPLGGLVLLKDPFKPIKDIAGILKDKKLFEIKEYLGIDMAGGENSEHYSVSIDKEVLKAIIFEYVSLYLNEMASQMGFSPEEGINELTQEIGSMVDMVWDAVGAIDLEVWLSKQGLLKKVKFYREFTEEELDKSIFSGVNSDVFIVNFEIEFSDFNKEVDIEIPEKYIGVDELLAPIRSKVSDNKILMSIAQSRTVMVYINANDGDYDNFNCQQEDIAAFCKAVVNSGGEMKIAKDKALDSKASCIYSKLTQQENYWYCADSTGMAGYASVDPGGVGYCVDGISAVCPPINR